MNTEVSFSFCFCSPQIQYTVYRLKGQTEYNKLPNLCSEKNGKFFDIFGLEVHEKQTIEEVRDFYGYENMST